MKNNNISTITGLTQEETSMWLSINRSMWSMFESGKRSMPAKSLMSIASLLNFIKNTKEIPKETEALLATENKEVIKMLQQKLRSIEIDLIRTQRKIKHTEEKRNRCLAALNAAVFIADHPNTDFPNDIPHLIRFRCLTTLKNYPLSKLELMKLKTESLEKEKESIALKLKNNL